MRAVVTDGYGSVPRVADVDHPKAGIGEVRVRVVASSLNRFDVAVARGQFKGMTEHRFPVVLGRDFAGTVDQIGPGVLDLVSGDDVFGVVTTFDPLSNGAFADYVVVPARSVATLPPGLDLASAGVLGLAGSAALGLLAATNPGARDTVLVSGATGGVGTFALQLLAARGATIIASTSSLAGAAYARSLGAAHVVDHNGDLAAQLGAIAPGGVDVVLHLAGDPHALASHLVDGGRFASLLGVGPEALRGRDVTVSAVSAMPDGDLLERLANDVASGRMRAPVMRTFTLADVPHALANFATGTVGKLAVKVA